MTGFTGLNMMRLQPNSFEVLVALDVGDSVVLVLLPSSAQASQPISD